MTNVLVITTTVRVVNGVHSNTTHARPAVALGLVFVESATSLEQRLLNTSTTSNNTYHGTAAIRNRALLARGELNLGSSGRVTDDSAILTGGTSESATVSNFLLHGANNGTLRHVSNGKNVTNVELGLLSDVDELTSIHALSAQEKLLVETVAVRRTEGHLSDGGSTARIMDNILDNSTEVTVTLRVVEGAKGNLSDTVSGVTLEDSSSTLTLS